MIVVVCSGFWMIYSNPIREVKKPVMQVAVATGIRVFLPVVGGAQNGDHAMVISVGSAMARKTVGMPYGLVVRP